MPNQELKLAAVQADIASDEPAVQSEPKQDLKQFGHSSLGEIAVAVAAGQARTTAKPQRLSSGDERP